VNGFSLSQIQKLIFAAARCSAAAAHSSSVMHHYTPEWKQHVLEHYCAGVRGCGFGALAARFDVAGGESTVRGWHKQWDGSIESLQHKSGAGRPRILTEQQVQQHIVQPIRRSNRLHRAVHYQPIRADLIAATGKQPSERTVRRYGHDAAIKEQRTKKRTAHERKLQQQQQHAMYLLIQSSSPSCCLLVSGCCAL